MKRISAWFDRHPKTRIALQLAVDALPFLLLALSFVVSAFPSSRWTSAVINSSLSTLMYGGGVAIFLLGVWLRKRAERAFTGYPRCETLSDMLRVLSGIPAFISFICLVVGVVNGFRFSC